MQVFQAPCLQLPWIHGPQADTCFLSFIQEPWGLGQLMFFHSLPSSMSPKGILLPVLMAQARIPNTKGDWKQVGRQFKTNLDLLRP